ncbi:MAG: OadG family protein [Bacteroidales bacterium]|nr:OadG family protein [Bacteroidales bacterium]
MGFQLMLIGMVTVFMILMIVIYGSKLLISVINKIAPEEVKKEKSSSEGEVPMAILQEAVAQLTGGKGHIVNLTRIN